MELENQKPTLQDSMDDALARKRKHAKSADREVRRTPFVHRFETDQHKYIYDANTMYIARVDEITWKIIVDCGVLTKAEIVSKYSDIFKSEDVEKACNDIEIHQRSGLFLPTRPKVEFQLSADDIKKKLSEERLILTLNVTESCNFHCRYCVYSGRYHNRPVHSNKKMEWSVAQKAIDEFLLHSDKSLETPTVSFYGGEPLLNFPLMKKCMNYIRDTYSHRDIHYAMTTNGSLLKGDIAEFVASEDNLTISVSLDGPREIHDRYRRTTSDEPTWDIVTGNVRDFIRRFPQHKSNVDFAVVLAPPLDLKQLDDYFAKDELFSELMTLRISYLHDLPHVQNDFEQQKIVGFNRMYQDYFERLSRGDVNRDRKNQAYRLSHGLFLRDLVNIHKRFELVPFPAKHNHFPEKYCALGTCLPGVRRTFVGTDGDYWPCERLPQSQYLRIGSVNEGFDIPKIRRMLREWIEFSKDQCEDCWSLRDCRMGCFATVCDGEKPTKDLKRSECERFLKAKQRMIVNYCKVIETDPTNLDFMQEIKVERVRSPKKVDAD